MNGSAYTEAQIQEYLNHISLPSKYTPTSSKTLPFLRSLHRHQISTIPYDNLSLHYPQESQPTTSSTIPGPSLNPQHLFTKLVSNQRGRGGYCMENSIFFNHILRALGFQAYMTGVRIRIRDGGIPEGRYIGWTHIVNIVTLENADPTQPPTKWMMDVGFGGDGATAPVPMLKEKVNGEWLCQKNLGSQEIRLVYERLPTELADSVAGQKWFVYQYRNGEHLPWNSFYCFGEQEFMAPDFEIMNFYTGTSPTSFQTFTQMVVKFLREEEGGEAEIYGKLMLINETVKRNLGGKTEVVQVCETEEERMEALRTWFGIELTKGEKEGIKGKATELRRDR